MFVFAVLAVPLLLVALVIAGGMGPVAPRSLGWVFFMGLFSVLPYALAQLFLFNLPDPRWDFWFQTGQVFFRDWVWPWIAMVALWQLPVDERSLARASHSPWLVMPGLILVVWYRTVEAWLAPSVHNLVLVPLLTGLVGVSLSWILSMHRLMKGRWYLWFPLSALVLWLVSVAEVAGQFRSTGVMALLVAVLVFMAVAALWFKPATVAPLLGFLPAVSVRKPVTPGPAPD